jgi:outer membrane biosynthesis protein TonB
MFSAVQEDSPIDIRAALWAAVGTCLLHVVLFYALPKTLQVHVLPVRLVEVSVAPTVVPEHRLPPSMRLAETNAQANRIAPKETPFVAARNQTAAQPVPEKTPTKSALPKSVGETDTIRIAQGRPRSIDESEVMKTEGTPGSASAVAGARPKVGESGQATEAPRTPAANPERPRASVPAGTTGLLLRNHVGVNKAGMVAVDARFSNYGDYAQRMMEAIQSGWWAIIERTRFESVARGRVVVRFKLHRDGSVTDATILSSEVPRLMALACKDAVQSPAPFDAWRADMVALFGQEDEVTITFQYL